MTNIVSIGQLPAGYDTSKFLPTSAALWQTVTPTVPMLTPPTGLTVLDEWEFGGSAKSLIGKRNYTALKPIGTHPTFGLNDLKIADAGNHGLVSPFPDRSNLTFAAVAKYVELATDQDGVLVSSATSVTGSGTIAWFDDATGTNRNDVYLRRDGSEDTAEVANYTQTVGSWVFVGGVVREDQSKTLMVRSGVNEVIGERAAPASPGAINLGTRTLALGACYYTHAPTIANLIGLSFAGLMLFDGATDAAGLAEIYGHMKGNLGRRGVTV